MELPKEDRLFIAYMSSFLHGDEYGDAFLENDNRDDLYWSLGSIRRHSFSFFSVKEGTGLLLVGDKFGALTGIACEKAAYVDTVVPMEEYAIALQYRYVARTNLHIIVKEYDDWNLEKKYPYVLVNLDYSYGYTIQDPYEFDRLVGPAVKHLCEDGKLLITARGDCRWNIRRLLYQIGFCYWQDCDPLGNGALFIEASRTEHLSAWQLETQSPLVNDKWVRKHWIPARGGELFDQDLERIRQVVKVQVDLLQKLIQVCGEAGLKVYPMYGTLLGIVRDGGIIAGDDDIDVAMPRDDYDRLMQLTEKFDGKYFLQTPLSEDCFYGGYTKLRNRETTAIHPQNEWVDVCEGIGIDIFPMDRCYADKGKEEKKIRKIRTWQRLLYAKSYGYFRQFKDMPLLRWKSYKYIGKIIDRDKMIEKLNDLMKQGDAEGDKLAIYCHYGMNGEKAAKYLNAAAFRRTIPLMYEGVRMQVPTGWEQLLRGLYGDDYGNRLGFAEGKWRHGFYDVDTPYTVYKKRFGGLKHPETIQEPIVLFGDGSVFQACLKYYKSRVQIAHLVQLPGEDTMEEVMGIPVESWEEFAVLQLPMDSYRAVICSGDAREAERILRQAGYKNYYIFWYNRNWMLYANQTWIWREIQQL